jgi:hypothetical protein
MHVQTTPRMAHMWNAFLASLSPAARPNAKSTKQLTLNSEQRHCFECFEGVLLGDG